MKNSGSPVTWVVSAFFFWLAWNPTPKKRKKNTLLILGLEENYGFDSERTRGDGSVLHLNESLCKTTLLQDFFCVCRSINHFRNECSLRFCLLLNLQVLGSSCDVYTLLLEEGWCQACQSWWEAEVLIVKDLAVDWQHTWQMMSFADLVFFSPFFFLLLSLSPLFLPFKTLSSVCLCVCLGPFKTQTFSASWMSLVIVCIL